MKYFFERLKEPSTWAGLAAIGSMFGVDPNSVQTVGGAAVAVAAALAIFVPEKGEKK